MFVFVDITGSFSIFSIAYENVHERLAVSVTILLTFTAFQTITAATLPQTSERKLVDWYIVLAYLLQMLLVACTCLVSTLIELDVGMDTVRRVDVAFGVILFAVWLLFSAFFLSLKWRTMQNVYACCCCCKRKKVSVT